MEQLLHLDLVALVKAAGYLGIFAIIFAESGILAGFFLPGDILLFTAGFLASQGYIDIKILLVLAIAAAIGGDTAGYILGKKFGPKIFKRQDSLLFHVSHLEKAKKFYEQHGGKTIILARFLPLVRTFAPVIAGVGNMRYRTFLFFNIFGGLLWVLSLSLLGYYLGNLIPNIDQYILPIVGGIILVSVAPTAVHILRSKEHRAKIKKLILDFFKKNSSSRE